MKLNLNNATRIVRCIFTAAVLYFIYTETGFATAMTLAFISIRFELYDYFMFKEDGK